MATLVHRCGRAADDAGGQSGPLLSVPPHYSPPPKQTRSSSIFHVQRQNTNDSSSGSSSLGDHMADMLMAVGQTQRPPLTEAANRPPAIGAPAHPFVFNHHKGN